ncbi:MAG: hypothetical protein ACXIUQ_18915 [Cecembia sp.]
MGKKDIISFAGSFAISPTLSHTFMLCRLRFSSLMGHFANGILLIWRDWMHIRLRHRLRKLQLSPLTSLQVRVVLFAVCKERTTVNQHVNPFFFEGFLANNPIKNDGRNKKYQSVFQYRDLACCKIV